MSNASLEKGDGLAAANELHVENRTSEKTLDHDDVHIHNELAYKGDDSDGKVDWTARSIIAPVSLGGLYTGMCVPIPTHLCTIDAAANI